MTKLIALLPPNPLLDILTMASAAANMEGGTRQMATPAVSIDAVLPIAIVTADAKELAKTATNSIRSTTNIMCS